MEVMLAIVIIAILSTIAIPSVSSFLNNANQSADNAKSELYESALKIYVSQKAQIREYVTLDDNNREVVANSIALIVDDGIIEFEAKTKGWVFYYHPITLNVVAMEFQGDITEEGMVAFVDESGEPLMGEPDGELL